jgi:hypothetical protein
MRASAALLLVALILSTNIPLARADEIALSFVHGQNRIDVPASAVVSIEGRPDSLYRSTLPGELAKHERPYVNICFDAAIAARLCELTHKIVGEPLELWVGCKAIMKPVVRESLCVACMSVPAELMSELSVQTKPACQ